MPMSEPSAVATKLEGVSDDMADSSLADTRLEAVSDAISDLLDAYPDATSDRRSPSLTRAPNLGPR